MLGRASGLHGRVLAAALALPAGACQSAPAASPQAPVPPPAASAAPASEPAAAPAKVESEAVLANRRRHHAFTEQFLLLEKNQVNEVWRCLFGEDGNGYRFDNEEALKAALDARLAADPKGFLETVRVECVPKAQVAATAAERLSSPQEYAEALAKYGRACTALAASLKTWVAGAPKYADLKEQQQRVMAAGEKWRAGSSPGKADVAPWQYHRFLHCAVPELDKLAGAPALAELLAASCAPSPGKGREPEPAFLSRLRDSCLPAVSEPPVTSPGPFKHTFSRFAADHERIAAGWGGCFARINQEILNRDLMAFGQAWTDWLAASTKMYELIKKAFCEGGEQKFCNPGPR